MIKKKTEKSNLEKKSVLFFEMGIVVVLALLLVAFEWSQSEPLLSNLNISVPDQLYEVEELAEVTRIKEKIKPPAMPEEILIIDNEIDLPEDLTDFTVDINIDTDIDFIFFEDEPEEPDVLGFFAVQNPPVYNGGSQNEFQKHLQKLVTYPEVAQENDIQGVVFAQFIVDERGEVVSLEIVKSPHPVLSKAVEDAFELTNTWKPGEQWGRKVKVSFAVPVFFKLQ
jgi:protein TonB